MRMNAVISSLPYHPAVAPMKPKFDLHVLSRVLRAEKPAKPITAIPAPNTHQMNRLRGFLSTGQEVIVAQRPGKGGMDFNKLLSGKVFAVAADGFSPSYEKNADPKAPKVQKTEDGLPVFTSSGFYTLSTPEYPALDILECFTHLHSSGDTLLLLKLAQLKARVKSTVTTQDELDAILDSNVLAMLGDENNLVRSYDPKINKKRKLNIDQAKLAAAAGGDDEEDDGGASAYTGVEYSELTVSPKDGNPFVYLVWTVEGSAQPTEVFVLRERVMEGDKSDFMVPCTAAEAIEEFKLSGGYKAIYAALAQGKSLQVSIAQGHAMRTSPMQRNKVKNTMEADEAKRQFGDHVYILGAMAGWTPGLVSILHSKHPAFPLKDYDHLYYVAACRQAEVGMNKQPGSERFNPPQAVLYDFKTAMLQ